MRRGGLGRRGGGQALGWVGEMAGYRVGEGGGS